MTGKLVCYAIFKVITLMVYYYYRGWQNLVAYGTHNLVVVVDPRTVQCLQTLSHHKSSVIKVVLV